ncbi:hypothetical protein VR45_05795, partial [Streptomyces sp. NRRL S-495]
AGGAGWAAPVLVIGLAAAFAGLLLGGRRSIRTRYRPDPWALPEWLTAGSGVAVVAATAWLAALDPLAFAPTVVPPTAPVLPVAAAAAVLLGLLPAFVTPVPPNTTGATSGNSTGSTTGSTAEATATKAAGKAATTARTPSGPGRTP